MRQMLTLFLFLIGSAAVAAPTSADSKGASASQGADIEAKKVNDQEASARKLAEELRAQIKVLRAKEQAEISGIRADKTKSASAKEAAIKAIRHAYQNKRTDLRMKSSNALRSELMRIRASN